MRNNIIPFSCEYALHLMDESKKSGEADYIVFPRSSEEIAEILKYCSEKEIPVTVQGSRTGVGGGAVPFGGLVMSLEKLKGLQAGKDDRSVIAGAAVPLSEVPLFILLFL